MTLSSEASMALDAVLEARAMWWAGQHTKRHMRLYKAYLNACREVCTILIAERKA